VCACVGGRVNMGVKRQRCGSTAAETLFGYKRQLEMANGIKRQLNTVAVANQR
jgi:hypothetical protein